MTGTEGPTAPEGRRKTLGQAIRFGIVGAANTVLDFAIFSALRAASVPIVPANLVSASCGMVSSFFANRKFVFGTGGGPGGGRRQALLFVLGTAFSLYVLQSIVILAITRFTPAILDQAVRVAAWGGLTSSTWTMLVRSNTAKLVATAASLTFNFFFYRYAVFAPASVRAH